MFSFRTNTLVLEDVRRSLQRLKLELNAIHESCGVLRVVTGAAESITNGTANVLTQWDSASSYGYCTASATTNKITVLATGRYRVSYHARITLAAGTTLGALVYVNGATSSPKIEDPSPSGTDHVLAGVGILDLSENDYVQLMLYPGGAGPVNATSSDNGATVLVVQRIA